MIFSSIRDHCYVCKLGWMENEQTPVLYDRKGLWLCKVCKDLMDSREQKTQFIWRGIAGVDYD